MINFIYFFTVDLVCMRTP